MSAKELILDTVRKMSDQLSMEQILEELQILAAIRSGEQAIEKGNVVTHEEMKRRVKSWNTN